MGCDNTIYVFYFTYDMPSLKMEDMSIIDICLKEARISVKIKV